MFAPSNNLLPLLGFLRPIIQSSAPIRTLVDNQRASYVLDSLLKQIRQRLDNQSILFIDQRFENLLLSLAYFIVELDSNAQIRKDILQLLLQVYERFPTAVHYQLPTFSYEYCLPPAEVFSFAFHTALTEIAATSSDTSIRKQILRMIAHGIRLMVEEISRITDDRTEFSIHVYRYQMPFLLGALRSIGRISNDDQTLISQLYPMEFIASRQTMDLDDHSLTKTFVSNVENVLRQTEPISSSASNSHRTTSHPTTTSLEDELPLNRRFFVRVGSTYHPDRSSSSDRFHVCVTVSILEHFYETLMKFDHRLINSLDKLAANEYTIIHQSNASIMKSCFPYNYFGEVLILVIMKFFRDNLELLYRIHHINVESRSRSRTERLATITRSIFSFVQQIVKLKFLNLDIEDHQRYRMRVDANAIALDLLCLSCYDPTEAEKLLSKCVEKFSQDNSTVKSTSIQMPLLITAFEILHRLSTKYSSLTIHTIRTVLQFLTEPALILTRFYEQIHQNIDEQRRKTQVEIVFEKLRDKAIEILCKSLEIQYQSDPNCVEKLLVQLSPKLLFDKKNKVTLLVSDNIIRLMGQLTKTFQYSDSISDSISTRFQQCLIDAPSSVAVVIIDRLASLLIDASTTRRYGVIIGLLTTMIFDGAHLPLVALDKLPFAFNPASGNSLERSQAVIRALANVASQLEDHEELTNLLTNVLDIFNQLALQTKSVDEKSEKKNAGSNINLHSLLDLIALIATILNRMPIITDPSERLFRLFQHFWFHCVFYNFTSTKTSRHPQVYRDALKFIATKSPILTAENLCDLPLKGAMPWKAEKIDKHSIAEFKSQLNSIFESYSSVRTYTDAFKLEQLVYILSVYYVETYRVRYDSNPKAFQRIFYYLEDPRIIRDRYKIWHVIMAIGRISFEIYLAEMKKMSKTSERNSNLESQCQFLMVKRTSVRRELRDQAKSHLHLLLSANGFPHLSCSPTIIETLMNILSVLSYSLNDDGMHKVTTAHRVPNTRYTIQVADTRVKRQNLFETFVEFGRTLVEQALRLSPSLFKAAIQQFILKLEQEQRNPNAFRQHRGLRIVWEYLRGYSQSFHTSVDPLACQVDFTDYIAALAERSAAMGFVQGLDASEYRTTIIRLQTDIERQIRHRLDSIEKYKSSDHRSRRMSTMAPKNSRSLALDFEHRLAIFDSQMKNSLFKLTAILISNVDSRNDDGLEFSAAGLMKKKIDENPLDRLIIHAITWLPVNMFTTAVMESAVDCWSWAIVGRPELELLIVQEIYRVWEKLMNERQGLYARETSVSSPLAPSEKDEIQFHIPSISPHRIFFKFIEERVYLAIYQSDLEMEILGNLFEKSLSAVPMSRDINACGLRFRVLSLTLYLIQNESLKSVVTKSLLREKVYQSAFDYFTIQHRCPTQKPEDLNNDLRKLIQFFVLIQQEKFSHQENRLSRSIDEESNSHSQLTSRSKSNFDDERSERHSTLKELKRTVLRRSSSSTSSNKSDRSRNKKQSFSFAEKRLLLLTLLANEIERLETFHNPLARSELNIISNNYTIYKNWKLNELTDISKKQWTSLAQLAWHISPDLAIVFYQISSKKSVQQEIQSLIRENPRRVRHIPDALPILTRHVDRPSNAQSVQILTWQPINPVAALAYFASARLNHVNNPYTIQYASRILYTTKPDALMLYIPQLVQAIRHDDAGFVRRLLLDLSKKSNLLAHQLIWNIRTNTFRTETTPDEEMQTKLGPIIQQIEENFTENAKQFYQRVFAFSDQLTNVSDKIKSFDKGLPRKRACLEALREIGSEVPTGVYLPSNPEAIVISLDPESGAPMQSAEKAPYRATFRVQTVGIDQIERCADSDYEFIQDFSRQYSQMAIFKVGDDVRQDILALQLMRLFHNIFEQEGLDLYLYTYRVIATSPGCGVIECVPHSRSREEIGRSTARGLFDYFLHTYGKQESIQFQHARRNFVMSMAAYSVALFLLQIKDRHNGNIMIDDDGHIIHIDFGFLFESSPGGNIGFEPDFKLTAEMVLIMGDLDSPGFLWFKELCIKGYLALRPYRQYFLILVALMLETGYPCFRGKTLEQFEARFKPDANEVDAARYMEEVIDRCTHNIRTRFYDYIQYKQNSIPY